MSMSVNVRERGGVTILDLKGRIVLGDGALQVQAAVKELLAAGRKKLILNLAGVHYIDTVGVSTLVGCHCSAVGRSAAVKLLNLQRRPRSLLVDFKLTTIFEVFDEEEGAIRSFAEKAAVAA